MDSDAEIFETDSSGVTEMEEEMIALRHKMDPAFWDILRTVVRSLIRVGFPKSTIRAQFDSFMRE